MKKVIVITAGGTSEAIDAVRKITNMSTGKLGYEICKALIEQKKDQIEKIYYLCPKEAIQPEANTKVEVITTSSVDSLKLAVETLLKNNRIDYFIHSMAVSDYTVDYVTSAKLLADEISNDADNNSIESIIKNNKNNIDNSAKISSNEDNLIIKLKPTPKIISIIKELQPTTYLVGFKLLNGVSEEVLYNVAYNLLKKNKCNLVIANDLKDIKEGHHKAILIDENGAKDYVNGKEEIAKKLVKTIM